MKAGRPRKYTDAQVAALRAWRKGCGKSFIRLCIELGISGPEVGRKIRSYQFKMPSP